MFATPRRESFARQVFLVLAMLALALNVIVPQGFMARAPSDRLPFAIVLCTGQGAMTLAPGQQLPGHADHDKAPAKSGHDAPCAFAGHGVGATPPAVVNAVAVEFAAYQAPVAVAFRGLAPGRGLTGPPLPARGPPSLLI